MMIQKLGFSMEIVVQNMHLYSAAGEWKMRIWWTERIQMQKGNVNILVRVPEIQTGNRVLGKASGMKTGGRLLTLVGPNWCSGLDLKHVGTHAYGNFRA